MKLNSKLLFAAFAAALILGAQTLYSPIVPSFAIAEHIKPVYVPNVATDVWTKDVSVDMLSLSNVSNASVTCDVLDKQSTPLAYYKTVTLQAAGSSGSVINDKLNYRWFPGGLTWSCSAANAVVGYVRIGR